MPSPNESALVFVPNFDLKLESPNVIVGTPQKYVINVDIKSKLKSNVFSSHFTATLFLKFNANVN